MKKLLIPAAVIIILLLASFFIVDNTETVIVTRLGKPVRVIEKPGLQLLIPFMEAKLSVTKRLMYYTSTSSQVITKDKKSILIDNYCVWRVKDPLLFRFSAESEQGVLRRINDVIYAGLRVELAKHDLIEIINERRRQIMDDVIVVANEKVVEIGVEIVDIRIKKADLPKENEKNIFARMITERERIAKQYRSEGQEEAQKIRAKTDMDAAVIVAEAEKQAQSIKGEAEAKAIRIYADAFNTDPAFYEYNTLINFYRENKKPMKIIIGTDSKFFKIMKDNR
jgi:membrane protease subunit HflC